MHRGKSRLWLLALVAILSMLAAACAGGDEVAEETETDGATETVEETETTDEAVAGGEFSTYISEPESLFTTNSTESEGNAVLDALYTGLVEYDTRTTEPYLAHAESIETDDFQTWTITLKDGWTFHNGEPVTAQSYVDAWNYAAYLPNAQQTANFFSNIEGFEAVHPTDPDGEEGPQTAPEPTAETLSGLTVIDDNTFEVVLSEPFSQWDLSVGYEAFSPLPPQAFEDPQAFNEQPVGNGPFMMTEPWEHNQQIVTEAFADYQGEDVPAAEGMEFRIYADINTAYNDLLAGNLDVMDQLPPERVTEAEAQFGENYGESPSSSYNYLAFPAYLPEFQNADLRHALSLAVDREAITETIFAGGRQPAHSFIAPVIPGYREDACAEWTEYDPERAAELFEQAGGFDGTMTIWFNSGAGHDEWITAVSNFWRDNLGIEDFEFQQLQFAEYLPLLDEQGVTGPFRLGWGMDYPSPQNYLEPLWSTQAQPPGGSNSAFYSNPEFDALIAEGNQQESLDEAIPFYQDAEDILCEDLPGMPMFYGLNQYAHSDRVDNLYVDAFGNINYSEIEVTE